MLARTRPFNPAFDRRVDRAFDELTSSFVASTRRTPVVDATWRDGSLVLTVDLPGTPGDAIAVAVAGRTLTLSVTTPAQTWERSVRLGATLDADAVSASYLDGRLTVTVAAVATAEPRSIEISTRQAAPVVIDSDTAETPETA
ncbi:MAG: Hsp20 family protein [Ilumatobacteraceae bacterium]